MWATFTLKHSGGASIVLCDPAVTTITEKTTCPSGLSGDCAMSVCSFTLSSSTAADTKYSIDVSYRDCDPGIGTIVGLSVTCASSKTTAFSGDTFSIVNAALSTSKTTSASNSRFTSTANVIATTIVKATVAATTASRVAIAAVASNGLTATGNLLSAATLTIPDALTSATTTSTVLQNTTTTGPPVAIIGGVVGGVAAAILLGAYLVFSRKKKTEVSDSEHASEPKPPSMDTIKKSPEFNGAGPAPIKEHYAAWRPVEEAEKDYQNVAYNNPYAPQQPMYENQFANQHNEPQYMDSQHQQYAIPTYPASALNHYDENMAPNNFYEAPSYIGNNAHLQNNAYGGHNNQGHYDIPVPKPVDHRGGPFY
ncbi:hypothetical protein HK096_005231 [Nowakowskiella sp. JEL0078]|nr:hypothetical protein HK096_005231 [Nowakowskiella sp. JEL0078]